MLILALSAAALAAPTLSLTGTCGGTMTATVTGAVPGASVALLTAASPGSAVLPPGPCGGAATGLAAAGFSHRATLVADGWGFASMSATVPAGLCGHSLQAIDASCTTTEVAALAAPASCGAPADYGTWFGAIDPALATRGTYSHDAGVAAVIAAAPPAGTSVYVDLQVTRAVVTNVDFAPVGATALSFWFADGGGHVRTFLTELGMDAGAIRPGELVSFRVTQLTEYFGALEVTQLADFTVHASGLPVAVADGMGTPLDLPTYEARNVHTYGEITANLGPCGGSHDCFSYQYGALTVDLRANNALGLLVGDCVEYVGPLDDFGGTPQLNLSNWDWLRPY